MGKTVYIVDDEPSYGELYSMTLQEAGFNIRVFVSAEQVLAEDVCPDMIVSDMRMANMNGMGLLKACRERDWHMPFLFVTAYADLRQAVEALKLGAVDYLEKPVDLEELVAAVCDATGCLQVSKTNDNDLLSEGIIVENPAMRRIYNDALQVAKSDATVLITGESGCGKDVLARYICTHSPRSQKPFVAVNCAAIPFNLLASELFGHEKGAFTGASSARKGRFREADGGTLFLDEIGDMPPELQASLLRALEQRTIIPVGSDREIKVDIRMIAATNADLKERIQDGRFREDLYYRLNVITFDLPSLRERREDILPLARFFLKGQRPHCRLAPSAERLIGAYDWPGNVRELHNSMERVSILSNSDYILPEHLPEQIRQHTSEEIEEPQDDQLVSLQQSERLAIEKALTATSGNRTRTAEILGISRRALLYKLKALGINS